MLPDGRGIDVEAHSVSRSDLEDAIIFIRSGETVASFSKNHIIGWLETSEREEHVLMIGLTLRFGHDYVMCVGQTESGLPVFRLANPEGHDA